jgi:hypothetical protein
MYRLLIRNKLNKKVHLVGPTILIGKSFTTHEMNNIKMINAQQTRIIHNCKNAKEKLLKSNAAI